MPGREPLAEPVLLAHIATGTLNLIVGFYGHPFNLFVAGVLYGACGLFVGFRARCNRRQDRDDVIWSVQDAIAEERLT